MIKGISSLWKVRVAFGDLLMTFAIVLDAVNDSSKTTIFDRVMKGEHIDPSTVRDISMELVAK